MRILECSSKGDKRFSAFYAHVSVYGKNKSIEDHYQSCKGFNIKPIKIKGATPDYIIINNIIYNKKYLTPYYKLLWVKYLDEHKELVEYAKNYNDYNDIFKGHSVNCQADVIRQYIKRGRDSIFKEKIVQDFIKEIKNGKVCK